MDPKSEQYKKALSLTDAVGVIHDYLDKHNVYWARSPEAVVSELVMETATHGLTYGRAVEILRTAETEKMHGLANKGLKFIEQEWKKL